MPLHVNTESGRLYSGDLMPTVASSRSPASGIDALDISVSLRQLRAHRLGRPDV